MATATARPDFVENEHLVYLDKLRESGVTNMWGARPYLMAKFPELRREEAAQVLRYWMDSFTERHQ